MTKYTKKRGENGAVMRVTAKPEDVGRQSMNILRHKRTHGTRTYDTDRERIQGEHDEKNQNNGRDG